MKLLNIVVINVLYQQNEIDLLSVLISQQVKIIKKQDLEINRK